MKIDCKQIEQEIMNIARQKVEDVSYFHEIKPRLAIITCGEDDASKVYVRNKIRKCNEVGIEVVHERVDNAYDPFSKCMELIKYHNNCKYTTAIILQLPTCLSKKGEQLLLDSILPQKDVDGLGRRARENHLMWQSLPCTSEAVLKLIYKEYGLDLSGKTVALYGRSWLVNRPIISELIDRNATIKLYNSTSPTNGYLEPADVSVVAIGKPRYYQIIDNQTKQLIIDVGINRDEDGKLCGDVDTRWCENNPNILYTPVPNGVGILTTSMLCLKVADIAFDYEWGIENE